MTRRVWIGLVAAWVGLSGSANAQDLSVRPILGGLPAESGLALGAELIRLRLVGSMGVRVRVIGSTKMYRQVEVAFEAPQLGSSPLFLELTSRYRNYPEENFWGLGPDTPRANRSNYRLEDVSSGANLGIFLLPGLRAGASGGFLFVRTGRGRDRQFLSIEELFTEAEAPAVDDAPDYRYGGLFVEYDTRGEPTDPQSGGLYALRWTSFSDRDLDAFSFRELDVDLRRFISLGDGDRIGLRLRALRTDPAPGHRVPFFLQPWAGGIDTVRGFHQYRFRDRNAVVFNGEYRRPVTGFLDAVAFADLGRVFSNRGETSTRKTHIAGGLGTRVKFGRSVFFGVDLGVGNEGVRVWFRSGHTY
jgi:outer membrane protein assembly factor BamA